MGKHHAFIDGERIRKARTVWRIEPIFEQLATELAAIPELRYIKPSPQRLSASNALSADGKKNPIVEVGADGVVGVELLIDADSKDVQFFAPTSAVKGGGRKIVAAMINATPEEWFCAVPFDWSGGFRQRMAQDYPA